MTQIDYSKLNERIVKQATDIPGFTLSEEQKKQLFQSKYDRAVLAVESRNTNPVFHTDR